MSTYLNLVQVSSVKIKVQKAYTCPKISPIRLIFFEDLTILLLLFHQKTQTMSLAIILPDLIDYVHY